MRLSENIRSFRKERALTQEQLAQALGVAAGRPLTAFDDMGDTAMEGIAGVIASCRSETLAELWKEISQETQQEPFSHGT